MEINDIAVIVIALGQIIGRSGLLIPGMEIGSVTQIYTVSQRIVSTASGIFDGFLEIPKIGRFCGRTICRIRICQIFCHKRRLAATVSVGINAHHGEPVPVVVCRT